MVKKEMTKEELFDLIAPIQIYNKADVMWRKEAGNAFRLLKKKREDEMVVFYFKKDIGNLFKRVVEEADERVFWRIYNQLFEELVLDRMPQLRPDVDTYGAKCFVYEGQCYLAGDDCGCYPYYESAELLKERLDDLKEELVS
jgi:hypothetical protein